MDGDGSAAFPRDGLVDGLPGSAQDVGPRSARRGGAGVAVDRVRGSTGRAVRRLGVLPASASVRGRRAERRVVQWVIKVRPSRGGLVVGLLFFCISLTPSLLPRTWFAQGLISAIATCSGYAIGVVLGWVFTRVIPRRWFPAPRVRRLLVRGTITIAAVLVVVSLYAGSVWQRELFLLMGERPPSRWTYLRVPGVTLPLVTGLVALARALYRGVQWLVAQMRRVLPDGPLQLVGVTAGLAVVAFVAQGIALGGFMSAANTISAYVNDTHGPATPRPTSPGRSGSPQSLVSYDSLGREGKTFVTGGPSQAALTRFSGTPAKEPIRVYVGLRSTSRADAPALAVKELERTGAFDRSVLCVVTTTGTGWVDPYLAAALEYLHNGDTAIVGTQYSYLPSWISFLSERDRVATAGRDLFDAVYAHWSRLPPDHRPTLLVLGESLGSLGSESTFSGLGDVLSRTGGALWSGPTNANPLWQQLERARDPGTPEVLPVSGAGAFVRFVSRPQDLTAPPGPWSSPRVVYLQNASDPVTWWSPSLLWKQPVWLEERAGRDVLPAMRWFPVVTFLQVTADLALAYSAPPGHGHQFHNAAVAAWAAIDAPNGWTATDTARLTTLLGP